MKAGALRISATLAIVALLAACGGGSGSNGGASPTPSPTPTPFPQADFNKSLATYMTAAGNNFQGFSTDTPLVGTSECRLDSSGTTGPMVECKVDTYDKQDEAMKQYAAHKGYVTKALPRDARGGEQTNAAPNTPVRFAAISGKGAVVVVLTKSDSQWILGYVFQKAPQ